MNDKINEFKQANTLEFVTVKSELKLINESIEVINENIQKEIHSAVRRSTATLKAQMSSMMN